MAACSWQASRCKRTRVLRHLYFTSGRHYWEVLVERMADPRDVVVGVAPTDAFEAGEAEEAVGYAATGVILHSGEEVCRAQAFAVGDTVGVYLDMNTRQVAFFLNDEAQLDPRRDERGQETTAGGREAGEDTRVGNGVGTAAGQDLEWKMPAYSVEARRISWYSFRARAVFAALGVSSSADSLVVVGSEVPDGYR
ncbi:E3 ubiquitin-protein ligase TRIM9 isoform X2 [Phytophthora cinnamomi]|uniref:E3 ubiquitin-protein ligase TRIM9 isoform X2 n=1 Tax=Phytophthora cinnamomi TaxID=4785 RepID=UPI00355AC87C|nr:E3 ubiquitin-protein ligase TRIM9 isoform X2 [Phytophthora cinnamomi]